MAHNHQEFFSKLDPEWIKNDNGKKTTIVPYIETTTPRNVTVIKGKTATLVCQVQNLGEAKVGMKSMKVWVANVYFLLSPCSYIFLYGNKTHLLSKVKKKKLVWLLKVRKKV